MFTTLKMPAAAITAVAALLLSGCTGTTSTSDCTPFSGTPATIDIDGSSTVYPIAEAWAEEFAHCAGIEANVAFSGTGGGFQKFCRGEIDVSDASRPIKSSESSACTAAGISPFEVQVAIDGLAVVVSKENTFVNDLKVSELNKIWTQNGTRQVDTWRELRPEWPAQQIDLFGPGTNSGTFDYFVEVIIHPFDGSSSKGRSDYTPSEDDNVLVQGVAGSDDGLGYFGLAYAQENLDKLRIVPIIQDTKDGGKTYNAAAKAVSPTPENVESGLYAPLSRPLFMYTNGAPSDQLKSWLEFGLSAEGQDVVAEVGYVKLPEAIRTEMMTKLG